MNIDKPLYWHQGLFLQPQHFQQNDARLESLVTRTLACQQPHAWGLISMCLNGYWVKRFPRTASSVTTCWKVLMCVLVC